jgi:hypothetical protein
MEVFKNLKEYSMSESKLVAICLTVVAIAGMTSLSYYYMQRDRLMSANIENGIVKGVDPVAIKCAYEGGNTMCLLYAATKHSQDPSLAKK